MQDRVTLRTAIGDNTQKHVRRPLLSHWMAFFAGVLVFFFLSIIVPRLLLVFSQTSSTERVSSVGHQTNSTPDTPLVSQSIQQASVPQSNITGHHEDRIIAAPKAGLQSALQLLPQEAPKDFEGALEWLIGESEESTRFLIARPYERRESAIELFMQATDTEFKLGLDAVVKAQDEGLIAAALVAGLSRSPPAFAPGEVLTRLESFGASNSIQAAAKQVVLQEWATQNLSAAKLWVSQRAKNGGGDSADLLKVADIGMVDAPEATLAWVNEHVPPSEETGALAYLFESWADSDPFAAGRWLRQQANHPVFDQACRIYALKFQDLDRDSALQWAGQIKDHAMRIDTLTLVGSDDP